MEEGEPHKIWEGLGADPSLMVLTSFPLYLAGQNWPRATQITEGAELRDKTEPLRLSLSPGPDKGPGGGAAVPLVSPLL